MPYRSATDVDRNCYHHNIMVRTYLISILIVLHTYEIKLDQAGEHKVDKSSASEL